VGKKRVITEKDIKELVLPGQGEVLGVVVQLLGYDRLLVKSTDGYTRICRIRGKMKRRVWIKEGDMVLIAPWDFQQDERGDVMWRYTRAQADWLRNHGYIKTG